MDFNLSGLTKQEDVDLSSLFDTVIIGLGPAAYSAGIYATRFNLNVLMIGEEHGGLVSETPFIENYPGVDQIDGIGLADLMKKQYLRLGGKLKQDLVIDISKKDLFEIKLQSGAVVKAKTVIASTGLKRRKLNALNEDKYNGKGISYCATCDAALFRNKTVAVVGGGDSAFTAAIHIMQFAKKVYIIHRRNEFRAQPSLVDRVRGKAEFIMDTGITEFSGTNVLKKALLQNNDGSKRELDLDGCFIEIGYDPTSKLFEKIGVKTIDGFIDVKSDMSTSLSGFFGAGDCTNGLNGMKQIITACAMGAIASEGSYKYVNGLDNSKVINDWKH